MIGQAVTDPTWTLAPTSPTLSAHKHMDFLSKWIAVKPETRRWPAAWCPAQSAVARWMPGMLYFLIHDGKR